MAEKDKNIFEKAVDAFSSRDEKAAADAAAAEAAQAKSLAASATAEAGRQKAAAEDAKKKAAEAEAKMAQMKADDEAAKRKAELDAKTAKLAADMKASTEAMKAPKFIAEHKLTSSETLSHLSLKYYGSAIRDYWMVIYEANKEVIGPNPALVVPGMIIKIPVLPANLPMKK
jgi:nucleoid-associated protein YgaU